MPSLLFTSRLPVLLGKKRKSRMAIADAGSQFDGNPGASSLPMLTAAPELGNGLRLGMCDEQKGIDYNSDGRDKQNTTRRAPSPNLTSTGKGNTIPPTPVITENMLSPPVVPCSPQDSRHLTLEPPSPSRIARKASKIGSNIVSDVKAGSASFFGGMRRSRQSETADSNRERMKRLGEMDILSTDSSAVGGFGIEAGEGFSFDGYGCDKEEKNAEFGRHVIPGNTKGIMKKNTTTCPEIQIRPSRSIMNPKMVDPKPSVRFTLDLPPKLDLDLSFSELSLNKGLEKNTEAEKEMQLASGSWAKRTTAAVLDKSRDVKIDTVRVEEYLVRDSGKDVENSAETPASVEGASSTTSNIVGSKDSANLCLAEGTVTATEPQILNIDQISTLSPIEPGLTIYRLEDMADAGSRFPSKLSSRRESSVYVSVLSAPLGLRNSSDTSDSRRSSIFDVRQQARADAPASLIKMRIEGEIEEVTRTISARMKVGDKGLRKFKDDSENDRSNECVSA